MRARALVLGSIVLIACASLIGAPRAEAKNVTVVIEMRNFAYAPNFLQVDPGDNVSIVVFNNESGSIPHTFDLDTLNVHLGTVNDPMLPGENRSVTFSTDRAGTYWFHCAISGHATNAGGERWTGMAGRLQVGAAPSPGDATPIIAGGLVVLVVSVAGVVFVTRRGKEREKSP